MGYGSSLQNALICLWTLRCCIPYFRGHVSTRSPGSLINHRTLSLSCFFFCFCLLPFPTLMLSCFFSFPFYTLSISHIKQNKHFPSIPHFPPGNASCPCSPSQKTLLKYMSVIHMPMSSPDSQLSSLHSKFCPHPSAKLLCQSSPIAIAITTVINSQPSSYSVSGTLDTTDYCVLFKTLISLGFHDHTLRRFLSCLHNCYF